MRLRHGLSALILFVLSGCVGTDYIDDPLMPELARIEVTPRHLALQAGKTAIFQATYFDSLGNNVPGLVYNWSSSDSEVVVVDATGRAMTLKTGQARIVAQARGLSSEPALLTVVADSNQVAAVIVTPDSGNLVIGGALQLTASARNLSGAVLSGKTFTWHSSAPTIASVNSSGLVTALAAGEANIFAQVEGIASAGVRLSVVSASRSGSFSRNPNTSYNVSGTATLERQPEGSLVLKLGADFSSSNGPGLEVFLSTTNSVGANSINLGKLQKTTGAQSYSVPSNVNLASYDWAIIHCVPFNTTFGYAQLR